MNRVRFFLVLIFLSSLQAFAMAPLTSVPQAPQVSVVQAVQLADKEVRKVYAGSVGSAAYCSWAQLKEPEMSANPLEMKRHWILFYRIAGNERKFTEEGYSFGDFNVSVTMDGKVEIIHQIPPPRSPK
jgi:hypothetical protein